MDRPGVSTTRSLHTSQKQQGPSTNPSLAMPVITHPSPRTKAELAAHQFVPGDGLDLEKHIFTFSSPVAVVWTFVGATLAINDVAGALVGGLAIAIVITGHQPTPPPFEDLLAKQVHDIGPNASVAQLLEARSRLLAERKRGAPVSVSKEEKQI